MSEPNHLFVYGTLRSESGHPMATRLKMQAKHVGRGSAPGLLYDFVTYPGAVFDPEERARVIGDVFAIKPGGKLLAELDAYEAIDALYKRMVIEVKLAGGGRVDAWAYGIKDAPKARLIATGDFIAHRNLRNPRAVRP